jgi:tellurite methyltransferase
MPIPDPSTLFGSIDIYLFDQILRGRIRPGMRVLDAGCGSGRNLVYLLQAGYDVTAVDDDPAAIAAVAALAARLAPQLPTSNFIAAPIESMPVEDEGYDVVISSAVLHFAHDDRQFDAMLSATWRAVKRGGLLFCRLASTIGLETRVRRIDGRRFQLPDGSDRYLVDERMLLDRSGQMGGRLLDPLKTTVVQDQRSMTTWVLRKT